MRRYLVPGVVVGAAVALLALLAFGISNQGPNSSIDSALARGVHPALPDTQMALPVLGSPRSQTLADFRGRILVVNVFASWCTPCRAEAPILDHEQRVLAAHDGTIIGVTYRDAAPDAAAFARQVHMSYPVLRDITGSLARAWGVNGVPETFVINRQGRVVAVRRYQLADGSWLAQTVAPLLSQQS